MNDKTLQIKFKNSKVIIVNTYSGRLLASSLYCTVHKWLGQAKRLQLLGDRKFKFFNVRTLGPNFKKRPWYKSLYALPCIVSLWYYRPI